MTSRQLAEVWEFNRLEPIGEMRGDERVAMLTATLINLHRGKRGKAVRIIDCMLHAEKPPKLQQTPEEIQELLLRSLGVAPPKP